MDDDNENEIDKLINEEYAHWRKGTPFLYDLVLSRAMKWPSLTIEWYNDKRESGSKDYTVQHLLLGTHTSEQEGFFEPNHILIAKVYLPLDNTPMDITKLEDLKEVNLPVGTPARVEVEMMINHPGEVNRARFMPQNSSIIATKTIHSDVLVFDSSKCPKKPKDDLVKPNMVLKGHTKEGYGISWNPIISGQLLSGSEDHKICYWDIGEGSRSGCQSAHSTYTGHTDIVADVAWHPHHASYFGSVGDDGKFFLWDLRQSPNTPGKEITAHKEPVNCIAFSPFSEWILATGSDDQSVGLWDVRKLIRPLHNLLQHEEEVVAIQWSPQDEVILGSCGGDRRVNLWDLSRIGEEQSAEDKEDGPPELLFVHGGHTDKVSDFAWNPQEPWLCGSVSEDNILQIWKVAEHVYSKIDYVV